MEAAGCGLPPGGPLVEPDHACSKPNAYVPQASIIESAVSSAALSSAPRVFAPAVPTTTTKSLSAGIAACPRASRHLLFTVILRAMLPTCLETATAPLPIPGIQTSLRRGNFTTLPV